MSYDIDQVETIEPMEPFFEMLEMLISRFGPIGIGAAMLAESAGVPFASAIVLLTAGTMILRGVASFWVIFIYSTLGITLGSIFSYIIGLLGSMLGSAVKRRHFFHLNCEVGKNKHRSRTSSLLSFWKRYGSFSIFMAQLWGFSRTFISFPAGAMHMHFGLFVIYTFLGGALFSLGAIATSLLLTGTMSITIRLLKDLAEMSPFLLFIPALLIVLIVYLYRYRGWRIKIPFLGNSRFKKTGKSDR